MKASIFRKFYLTFANLYGVILFTDAHKIMKQYYPDLKEDELLKDLKSRNGKMTRLYAVLSTGNKKEPYLICDDCLDDDQIDDILDRHRGKPFFTCENVEEYFSYAETLGYNPGFEPFVEFAYKKFKKKTDKNQARVLAEFFAEMICENVHCDCGDSMANLNKMIQGIMDNLEPETEEEANKILSLFMELQRNVKMYTNRGYSPVELRELLPERDPENMTIKIGDNMRNGMMEDDFDIDGAIRDIRKNSDLPEKARNDLIRQLEEIKLLKQNKAKA